MGNLKPNVTTALDKWTIMKSVCVAKYVKLCTVKTACIMSHKSMKLEKKKLMIVNCCSDQMPPFAGSVLLMNRNSLRQEFR